jgi:hypothetical protein
MANDRFGALDERNKNFPHLTNHQWATLQKYGLCFYCTKKYDVHKGQGGSNACPDKAKCEAGQFVWPDDIVLAKE